MRRRHTAREFAVKGRQSYGFGGDSGQQRRVRRSQQFEAGVGPLKRSAHGG